MIKVLVVEDERPTARVIARLVEQHTAFTVVGTEANGERALQFLRANPVDLIISDIEMPVMDGLQLLETVHREFPQCINVMLTGFSYFAYARTALQFHAFDYVLKPIDSQELSRVLSRVEAEWRLRSNARTRALLEQALAGKPVEETGHAYHMILAAAQPDFWNRQEQIFGRDFHIISSDLDTERIILTESAQWNEKQAEALFHRIGKTIDLICTVRPVPLSELNRTAKKLRTELEQQARLFGGNLLFSDPAHGVAFRRDKPLRDMHPEQAVEAICAQNRAGLHECITQMWPVAERCGFLRCDVWTYLDAILIDSRIAHQLSTDKLHRTRDQLRTIIQTAADPAACTEQLTACLLSLLRETASKRDIAELVEEMARYLDANYHMPITVESLAKQYGFVPKYLNKVFRQYKGARPAEYLLDLRIRRARHMLETVPEILVKDVAASVGYSDHHYFSKVFHRATGLWPTEVQAK